MSFSIKDKIFSMFILGMSGTTLDTGSNIAFALKNNLGGLIFFTANIESSGQIKNLIESAKTTAKYPLFFSVDQEGGRVERTQNIHGGKKYLSAGDIAKKGAAAIERQTFEIARELKSYGFNMNFSPVMDVDTNENNPIIGERAYSNTPEEVFYFANIVASTYLREGIIPVAKHFPGHGDTSLDSHETMPAVDLSFECLEKIHIYPFIKAIEQKIPAIMVSHVHYSCFDKEKKPATLSANVVDKYLTKKLGYNGLIISDDMYMGAVLGFDKTEMVVKAVDSGINSFIFRHSDDEVMQMIDNLIYEAEKSPVLREKIDISCKKISKLKNKTFNF